MNNLDLLSYSFFSLTIVLLLMVFIDVETKPNHDCECGIQNKIESRVKNGTSATNNRYPWSIALKIHGKVMCGGSLISNKHVLTAAHCLKKERSIDFVDEHLCKNEEDELLECFRKPKELKIYVVDSKDLNPTYSTNVRKLHIHPDYDPAENLHDIAIVELEKPVSCSNESRPICLPSKEKQGKPNVTVYFSGWAPDPKDIIDDNYDGPVLRQETFRIWPVKRCLDSLKNIDHKMKDPKESMKKLICAAGDDSMTCNGDSGSAISRRIDGKHYVVGVNSFHSSSQCDPKTPAFYTQVLWYKSWINSILK